MTETAGSPEDEEQAANPRQPMENAFGESRLFQATVDRKRADQDAMLLANRIKLLRQEEAKAAKKIQDTHKRTREIVDLRRRNEENRLKREEELFMQEKELDERRDQLQQQREHQQRKIQNARGGAQNKKIALRDEIRSEKRELQHRQHTQMEDEYAKAATKRDRIRNLEIALAHRRHQTLADKQTGASDRLELRIATEAQRKTEKEESILRMEREEVELIQRLQRTQQQQRAAYDQLEQVLQEPHKQKAEEERADLSPKTGSARAAGPGSGADTAKAKAFAPALSKKREKGAGGPLSQAGGHIGSGSSASGRNDKPTPSAVAAPGASPRGPAGLPKPKLQEPSNGERSGGFTYTTVEGSMLPVAAAKEDELDFAAALNG